jgi:hypothetical protein
MAKKAPHKAVTKNEIDINKLTVQQLLSITNKMEKAKEAVRRAEHLDHQAKEQAKEKAKEQADKQKKQQILNSDVADFCRNCHKIAMDKVSFALPITLTVTIDSGKAFFSNLTDRAVANTTRRVRYTDNCLIESISDISDLDYYEILGNCKELKPLFDQFTKLSEKYDTKTLKRMIKVCEVNLRGSKKNI